MRQFLGLKLQKPPPKRPMWGGDTPSLMSFVRNQTDRNSARRFGNRPWSMVRGGGPITPTAGGQKLVEKKGMPNAI